MSSSITDIFLMWWYYLCSQGILLWLWEEVNNIIIIMKDKFTVVTGASTGIGRAIAVAFAREEK
ncbi:hypothetical protein MUP32_05255 [Candidatus Microgenomates bacterium]|nr:hypothetical protein [Candidatus Microgenomates bacterium]